MGLSLRKLGSKIFDQVNPFDNGRTYQQRTPTNNRSVVQQAVNSGASNVAQGVARNAVRVAGQTPVGRVVAPVVAPISSPQDFIDNVSVPVERAVTKSPVGRGLQGVGLGALRVGAGYAQAAGGAYDLATPGLGKNRLSKSATALGKQTDDTLKEVGGNQAIYKGAQLGSELLLLKGAGSLGKVGIKGLSQIPKVASGASAVSKGVKVATSPVTKAINPATAKVSQGITKVGTKGLGGKITAKAATNIVSPKYQGVNAAFSGIQLSKEAAQGRAITPERIATDLAIGGVAFPVAGAVGSQALLPGAKIALKGVGKGAKVSAKATQDAIQAVRNPLKPLNEAGFAKVPGKGEAPQVGKTTASVSPSNNSILQSPQQANPIGQLDTRTENIPQLNNTLLPDGAKPLPNRVPPRMSSAERNNLYQNVPEGTQRTLKVNSPNTELNEGGYAKIPKASQLPKVALKQETAPQAPVPENNLVDSLPNNNIASEQQIASALGMSDQQLKQAQLDSVPPRVEAPKLPVATRPKPTVETITSAPKEPLQYVEGQQALEKLAGNKTQEQLLADGNLTTGGSGIIPRVPTKVNKPIDVTADAVTGGTNNLLGKALRNQNPIVNMVGQIAYGLNRKSTLTNAEKSLVEQVQGRQGGIGSLSDDIQQTLEAPLKNLDEPTMAASKEKVFEAFLKHNAGDIPTSKAIIESFSPEERQYFDKVRELNKIRNELNRGQMADEVIAKGDEGMHMPRLYQFDESQGMTDDIEAYALSQNKTLDLNPAKRRKQLEDIAEELQSRMLRDPAQAAVIRTEIALHNRAIGQYSATIGKIANAVSDTNKRGYLQIPDSPKYGELSGKFVRKDLSYPILGRGDRLESQTSKAASELMDKWQAGVFGKIEDGLRQLLTVFNPATRLGNRGANIVQSQLSGFNIPEAAARQQHYMNVLKRGGDEMTRLAKTYGAIDDTDALAKFSGVQRQSKGMRGKLQKSYQNTDAGAKVAMFEWQLKKGATPQEAARFVNRALPNIGNSGEIYQFFSRLPVLGIPFRAIQPEVFRALGSAAGRHPVALISAMAAYSAFQSFTWEDVPEEERKQIEARFGAGNTPFAKLNEFTESNSLPDTGKVLPTSWSFNAGKFVGDKGNVYEVDPRRLAGIYSINTSGGDTSGGLLDEAKKISPAPIPFREEGGKLSFQPQELVGSRTFSTPYQMLIDRDFRGKSIQDPEGKIYNPDGTISYKYVDKETGKPTFKKDPARLAEFLARGYVTQTGDVENIRDAKKGNKNFYGQDMTVAQAGLRLAALKGERFTPERLKEMRQNDAYYAEKKEIDDMVKDKSPATQERFKRLTGYYKLREKVANEFKPGEERDKKAPVFNFAEDKWKEYTADPELYDLILDKKKRENKRQGSPIQPEFDERLSLEFRKQLINNKSLAPGEDAEADGKMYAHAEWDKYEGIKKEYQDKAKKYYPERKSWCQR